MTSNLIFTNKPMNNQTQNNITTTLIKEENTMKTVNHQKRRSQDEQLLTRIKPKSNLKIDYYLNNF